MTKPLTEIVRNDANTTLKIGTGVACAVPGLAVCGATGFAAGMVAPFALFALPYAGSACTSRIGAVLDRAETYAEEQSSRGNRLRAAATYGVTGGAGFGMVIGGAFGLVSHLAAIGVVAKYDLGMEYLGALAATNTLAYMYSLYRRSRNGATQETPQGTSA